MTDDANPPQPLAPIAQIPQSTDSSVVGDEQLRKSEEVTNKSQDTIPDMEKGSNSDTPIPTAKDAFFVEFEGRNDPGNPKSWTPKRRWGITVSMGLMVFTVTFASSIFSVNIGVVQELFEVKLVTATLGVALFVLVRPT
jgi:DHA1 family multidrug resistance protein-like MFS transporter